MKKIYKKLASAEYVKLLSYPPYFYFSLSVFFSQIAFNMLSVVLIFLIFHLTSSNFAVSILLLSILVPQILLSFIGGVLADIANKKIILILGNLFRAIPLLFLFFNTNSPIYIYLLALLISIITQFYVPAEAPLIPEIVKKKGLIVANSIFSISFFGSILIGYVLAGPVINQVGRNGVFLFLAALFLLASFFALFIPSKKSIKANSGKTQVETIKRSLRHELNESYSILKKTNNLGSSFFLLSFSQVIILVLATLVPGYAKSILEVPAEDLSLILFGPAAVGMIVSALLIGGVFRKKNKRKLMNIGVLISGVALVLLPFTSRNILHELITFINFLLPGPWQMDVFHFVLILAFMAGFANALIFVPSQAIIQEIVPENFRSKIYGLLFTLIGVFSLLPIIIAGGVADIFGVGRVLTSIGILIIFIGLIRENLISKFLYFTFITKRQ